MYHSMQFKQIINLCFLVPECPKSSYFALIQLAGLSPLVDETTWKCKMLKHGAEERQINRLPLKL